MVQPLFIKRKGFPDHKFPSLANATTTGPVTPLIYATQENVDLGIEGWARGTSLLAQGLVPLLVVGAMQFPQEVRAQVFQAVKTPPVASSPVTKFFSVPQQQYVDTSGQVFVPVSGFTPRTIPTLQGGPQLVDLTLPAQFSEPLPARQGGVPPLASGSPQPDPTQVSQVFGSVRSPPVAVSGIIPPFTLAAPEQIDLGIEGWARGTTLLSQGNVPPFTETLPQPDLTQAAKVWSSVRTPPAAASGIVPAGIYTLPQDPTQLAPVVWDSAFYLQGDSLSSEYRHGGHALALHSAEGLKSRLFKASAAVPIVSGFLGTVVQTLPQNEERPTRQFFPKATPPITGRTITPTPPVPPQFDISANGTVTWTQSTFSPSAPASDSYSVRRSPHRRAVR